ncbi:MAG: PilZ domain-containing protein [Acidobacteriota bacterium]
MDHEKRGAPRIDMPGGLPGEVSVLAPVTIREFSLLGAMLDTAFPLVLNSIHDVRLELEDRSIVVKGRIAHCSIADLGGDLVRYRAGIEFVDVPPHAAAAIKAYLDGMTERNVARRAARPPREAI